MAGSVAAGGSVAVGIAGVGGAAVATDGVEVVEILHADTSMVRKASKNIIRFIIFSL
jgi:hypothetical protein